MKQLAEPSIIINRAYGVVEKTLLVRHLYLDWIAKMSYFSLCVLLCITIGSANHLGSTKYQEQGENSGSANDWHYAKDSKSSNQPANDSEQMENTEREENEESEQNKESKEDEEGLSGEGSRNEKEPPRTRIKQGEVIGLYYNTYSGREIPAFYGLPFAAPPVGNLRFAAPQPPRSWDTPLKATNKSDFCMQILLAAPVVNIGREDCLYLDVYTPEVPKSGQCNKLHDVFIYIHPSGLQITSGTIMEPYYLMDKRDLVYVPINYRLGIIGFMASGDMAAPGNAGLKDQVMAMKWVQENIRSFCGDPNKVTLIGASYGSVSIGLHMLSPLSRGLFHRAIMGSGNPFVHLAYNAETVNATRIVANQMNCPTDDSQSMMDCLRQKNAVTFFDYELQYHTFFLLPLIVFSSVSEPCHEGAYLTKTPYQAYEDGDLMDIPVMYVHNQYEGLLFTFLLSLPGVTEVLDLTYKNNLKHILSYVALTRTENYEIVSEQIKQEYFGDGLITGNEVAFKELLSDNGFLFEWYNNSLSLAKRIKSPIYNMLSTYRGQYSTSVLLSVTQSTKNYGASHFDADLYVDFNGLIDKKVRLNENDTEMMEFMTELYYSFGTTGKPSIADKAGWKTQPREGDVFHYLRFENARDMFTVDDDNFARFKFWQSIDFVGFRGFPSDTCKEHNANTPLEGQKNNASMHEKPKNHNVGNEEQKKNMHERQKNNVNHDEQKNNIAMHEEQQHKAEEQQHNAEEQQHKAEKQRSKAELEKQKKDIAMHEEQQHKTEEQQHNAEEQQHNEEEQQHNAEEQQHKAEEQKNKAEHEKLMKKIDTHEHHR